MKKKSMIMSIVIIIKFELCLCEKPTSKGMTMAVYIMSKE